MPSRHHWRARACMLGIVCGIIASMAHMGQLGNRSVAGTNEEPHRRATLSPGPLATGQHCAVSCAHPLATRVGMRILEEDGTAVDALVAVHMLLNVVEPQNSGIGGGCFIVYYDAATGKVHCVDGREETPQGVRREDFLENGKVVAEDMTGGLPVGVPGSVAALWQAHRAWGRIPWPKLLAPAIALADEGFPISPKLTQAIGDNRSRLQRFPASRRLFLPSDGSLPTVGYHMRNPDLARTLELLARQGPQVFYEGEIARDIVRSVREAAFRPGKLELEDLRNYRAVLREPVRFSYRGYEIVSVPPPSSGGITLGLYLGLLERCPARNAGVLPAAGSPEEITLLAQASAAAYADRQAYLGDPDWADHDMRRLIDPEYLTRRATHVWCQPPGTHFAPGPLTQTGPMPAVAPALADRHAELPAQAERHGEGPHTTHIAIVDRRGNVVACTSTLEHTMGCALVVEGRGFLLNNELTDFDLDVPVGANALQAGRRPRRTALDSPASWGSKRPRSSMTPVIVLRHGKPYLTLGSPGGTRIISTVAQVLVNVLDHDMDLPRALQAPRMHCPNGPLELEKGYPQREKLLEQLRARGWRIAGHLETSAWGNVHAIMMHPAGTLSAAADPRGEGLALAR